SLIVQNYPGALRQDNEKPFITTFICLKYERFTFELYGDDFYPTFYTNGTKINKNVQFTLCFTFVKFSPILAAFAAVETTSMAWIAKRLAKYWNNPEPIGS
uniref:Uncharacterized protein n=1 Tax=Romanomermis culicivorax TaxID=13658 RepID=A0A915KLL6_ROMCU